MEGLIRIQLALSAIAIAVLPAVARSHQPDGSGDPKEVTCMIGEKPTGSSLSMRFCYTNAQWAELKSRYIEVEPNGDLMLAADAPPGTVIIGNDGQPLMSVNDPRNIHQQRCARQYTGGPSKTMSPNFNEICDDNMP